ncbi:MAG: 16S rRNA (cytidine(1402)-2'-O)-methyltransferase [Thermoleophilia bacterium]|nr:16S rRNA (cytidine(1402)-2'-O)-methyltransferase [Thermoleophilia bacterium]
MAVVATPIGNLGDCSPRAAETLRDCDVVACEDTRRTATLLRAVGARTPMVSLHAHNEASRLPELVRRMAGGERVALVSDAGMPGVSDPGMRLVTAAHEAGIPVTVLPGPSAVTAAVAAAGAPADRFAFAGFMPRRAGERTALLESLDRAGATVVAFESPQRLPDLMAFLAERHPGRRAAVCRELSKLHEETLVGTCAELAEAAAGPARGEITVVLWPAEAAAPAEGDLERVVEVLVGAGLSTGAAADAAAALGAGTRNAAYRAAIAAASRRAT